MYTLLLDKKVEPVLRKLAWLSQQNASKKIPTSRLRRTIANARRHAERMAKAQKQHPDLADELSEAWDRWADHGSSTRWAKEVIDFAQLAKFTEELLVPKKRAVRIELVQRAVAIKIQPLGLFNAEIASALKLSEAA